MTPDFIRLQRLTHTREPYYAYVRVDAISHMYENIVTLYYPDGTQEHDIPYTAIYFGDCETSFDVRESIEDILAQIGVTE